MLCSALAENNERLLGGIREEAAGQAGPAPDTAIFLDNGDVVRAHSVVLAAGAQHYRAVAQVRRERLKQLKQLRTSSR